MAAPGRALIVGLGCVGLVVAAAGIWFWWFLDLVTATDPEPYFHAQALIAMGCVIIFAAVVWWRRTP